MGQRRCKMWWCKRRPLTTTTKTTDEAAVKSLFFYSTKGGGDRQFWWIGHFVRGFSAVCGNWSPLPTRPSPRAPRRRKMVPQDGAMTVIRYHYQPWLLLPISPLHHNGQVMAANDERNLDSLPCFWYLYHYDTAITCRWKETEAQGGLPLMEPIRFVPCL